MSDTIPNYALNIMILGFDTFYLVRDVDIEQSPDLEEFVKSDASWVHDAAKGGYTTPRTILVPTAESLAKRKRVEGNLFPREEAP